MSVIERTQIQTNATTHAHHTKQWQYAQTVSYIFIEINDFYEGPKSEYFLRSNSILSISERCPERKRFPKHVAFLVRFTISCIRYINQLTACMKLLILASISH